MESDFSFLYGNIAFKDVILIVLEDCLESGTQAPWEHSRSAMFHFLGFIFSCYENIKCTTHTDTHKNSEKNNK